MLELTDDIRRTDPLYGRPAPRELSDKERESVHLEFLGSEGLDLLGELMDVRSPAEASAFVQLYAGKLLTAECEELARINRKY